MERASFPGRPEKSLLLKFVADQAAELRMPPEGDRLSAAEIAVLTKWIAEGATWPEGNDDGKSIDRRDHWSFKPIAKPRPPSTRDESWPRNAV